MKQSGVKIKRIKPGLYTSSNGFTITKKRLDDGSYEWQIWGTAKGYEEGYISTDSYAEARSKVCFELPAGRN